MADNPLAGVPDSIVRLARFVAWDRTAYGLIGEALAAKGAARRRGFASGGRYSSANGTVAKPPLIGNMGLNP
jgi:hypothetical protein